MHDMDRITNEEYSQEYGFLNEGELGYEGEGEWEGEYEGEFNYEGEGEWEGEYEYEGEFSYEGEGEWEGEGEGEWEWEGEYEGVMSEELEYELASELLGITNEEELEQFLGGLVKKIGGGLSRFAKSGLGKKLIGGLKSVAKVGLPILGKAAGTFFGGPVGGMIGGKLGNLATKLFEIQAEGMSNEDLEFEMARRYVRLAGAATKNTIKNAKKGGSPNTIVTKSIKQAAAKHAPGLLSPKSGNGTGMGSGSYSSGSTSITNTSGQSGTWTRKGNKIFIYGV